MIAPVDYLIRHSIKLVAHHGATNVEPASVAIAVAERIPVDSLTPDQALGLYVELAGFIDAYERTGLPLPYWMDCATGELQRLRDRVMMSDPDMTEPDRQPDDTTYYTPDDDETADEDVEVGVETPISGMTPLDDTAPSPEDGSVTEYGW